MKLEFMTIQQLHAKLVRVHSEYIRLRDADEWGMVTCPFCKRRRRWNDGIVNMHFKRRGCYATKFHDVNCNAGCAECNARDDTKAYRVWMIEKYGESAVALLDRQAKMVASFDATYYRMKISHYQKFIDAMKSKKENPF